MNKSCASSVHRTHESGYYRRRGLYVCFCYYVMIIVYKDIVAPSSGHDMQNRDSRVGEHTLNWVIHLRLCVAFLVLSYIFGHIGVLI